MPIRPFPLPLSIGTDIVSINRIKKIIEKDKNHTRNLVQLVRRILTRHERVKFWNRYQSYDLRRPGGAFNVSQFLAGRFAAKEATFKAVLWRKLSFHDVIIRSPATDGEMASIILDRGDAGEKLLRLEAELLRSTENDAPLREGVNSPSNGTDALLRSSVTRPPSSNGGVSNGTSGLREDASLSGEDFGEAHAELHGQLAKISISHDGAYATAVCLAAEEPSVGDVGGEAAARGYPTVPCA